MSKRTNRRRMLSAAALAAGAIFVGPGAARANSPSVRFDLRVHDTGAKQATVSTTGDRVLLDLYAIVQGSDSDPSNDSLDVATGNFLSSSGGLLGNLFGLLPPPPFNASGSAAGAPADLDGDGDLDVGSGTGTSAEGLYAARSGGLVSNPPGGQLIGRILFTPLRLDSSASTDVNFVQRTGRSDPLAIFDGGSIVGPDQLSFSSGAPVTITSVPEVDPPDAQYFDGSIDTHIRVVSPIRVTPGGALGLTNGLDVTSSGSLEGRQGTLSIAINDDISANSGGRIDATSLDIATSTNGIFDQSGGVTRAGQINIAAATGFTGALNLKNGELQGGNLTIGASGTGLLSTTGGNGMFDSVDVRNGSSIDQRGGSMFIIRDIRIGVDGAGSMNLHGGDTTVGGALTLGAGTGGTGTLTVRGGAMTAGAINLGAAGSIEQVQQTDGTIATGALSIGHPQAPGMSTYAISGGQLGATRIGTNANGIFNQTGGSVTVTGQFNFLSIPSAGSAPAQYMISNGTLTAPFLSLAQTNSTPVNGHTGGFVQTGGTVNIAQAGISSTGTYQALGGTLNVSQDWLLRGTMDFGGSNATANFAANSIGSFTQGRIINASNATFTGGAGSLLDFASLDQYQGIGTVQTQGMIHIDGQPLDIPQDQSISGSGTIRGNVTNAGTLAPGAMTLAGNYAQAHDGALALTLSDSPGSPGHLLDITGSADLHGALRVSLAGGFEPAASDRFTILQAQSLSGVFENALSHLELPNGRFDVVYSPTSVTLTDFQQVPEPVAAGLLALVAPMAIARRRRRCT